MLNATESDKHQRIIDAAVRVFARKGYYSSWVADIAREAGVAVGTVYLYFRTKDQILVNLFREKMALFVASLARGLGREPDPPAKLRRLIRHHFEMRRKLLCSTPNSLPGPGWGRLEGEWVGTPLP